MDEYTQEYIEHLKRVEKANEIIKTEKIYDYGVYKDGILLKSDIGSRFDAVRYMDDLFFVGRFIKLIGIVSPEDYGYSIELISYKTNILNLEEVEEALGEKFIKWL